MAVFKCKMCGGALEVEQNQTVVTCEYCGTQQTLPKLDDDRRANLYDRANHFRRNNEFDKAMAIYEQILTEDNTDAEAYWSLVLCRYGIEYVEDPATRKRIPTVNRAQFTSVFDDDNYKSALEYGDGYQRHIFEEEAKAINEIQKGILAISQKEEPFDVFICYKETDQSGRRTPDSVLANDLYHQLTQEGFKVFFARITLEDKLGTAYEPYIFAALNSSKVMVALGTKPEYFNAVWVKNEWSRYLGLIKQGEKKMLIPAYKDMDPYDLPEEFSHLQAQDMSKLGFMQDLIRGIKKIVQTDEPKSSVVKETVISTGSVDPLLKRAFMFLDDGDWNSADEYCEKVLDIDPENAMAYLGKLLSENRARRKESLLNCEEPFDRSNNYKKAVRFGDEKLKTELALYLDCINTRNENERLEGIYSHAEDVMFEADTESTYKEAAQLFDSISEYKDSAALAKECYESAETVRKDTVLADAKSKMGMNVASYEKAIELFESIPGWKDADEQASICKQKIEQLNAKKEADRIESERQAKIRAKKTKKIAMIGTPIVIAVIAFVVVLTTVIIPNGKYNDAVSLMDSGDQFAALNAFNELGDYKDAEALCVTLREEIAGWDSIISTGAYHTVVLKSDGTAEAAGYNEFGQCDVSEWCDIVAVGGGSYNTVGLKSDGTVVTVGDNECGQCDVSEWNDVIAISAGFSHTVGLKSDGIVVAVGSNNYGQCEVSEWRDIVAISSGLYHTVGLKTDGTVVAVGSNMTGQCMVSEWRDIVAISAGSLHTVGLKSDGTVVSVGENVDGRCDVSGWSDIVAISAGIWHTIGLKSDGTVVAVGHNQDGVCDISGWSDIVAISSGSWHTIGLKSDGTVVAVGYNEYGQCEVSDLDDIKIP